MCPFSRALQPSYLIVNDAAIRFKIGNMLVNTLLPHLMMNNTMPAMISVAMVTLLGHNYTEIVSGGVSVVNLFPCAWLYSTLANTGKTTALNLGQSCMGTKLIMTSGSTIPHARVHAGQSGGLGVVVLDDYSPAKMEEFAVFIRAVAGEGDEGRVNTAGTYVGNRQTAYAFSVNIYLVLTHIFTPPTCIISIISFIHPHVIYRPTTSPSTRRRARASSHSTSRRWIRSSIRRTLTSRRRTLLAFSACLPPTSSTSSSTRRACATAPISYPRSPAFTVRAPTRTPRSCYGRRSTSSACSPSPRSRTRSRSLRCSTSRTKSAPPPSSRRNLMRRPSSLGSSGTRARACIDRVHA